LPVQSSTYRMIDSNGSHFAMYSNVKKGDIPGYGHQHRNKTGVYLAVGIPSTTAVSVTLQTMWMAHCTIKQHSEKPNSTGPIPDHWGSGNGTKRTC